MEGRIAHHPLPYQVAASMWKQLLMLYGERKERWCVGHAAVGIGETSCNCSSLGRICSLTPLAFLPLVQGESKLLYSPNMVVCPLPVPGFFSQCLAATRIDGKRFERLQMWRL